jgi:hypothetical protein
MTHPITPPPELVQQWLCESAGQTETSTYDHLAIRAAQWGADQELEACCVWVNSVDDDDCFGANLRAARRPKPPSLKQQALAALDHALEYDVSSIDDETVYDTIRRALEALPND